ncbi:MAG: OmpA family protein [Bacteroidota bacterium]
MNGTQNSDINYSNTAWYHNYKTDYFSFTVQGIWTLNSFNFKQQIRKLNWYILAGVGANTYRAYYDALDDNGNMYDFTNIGNNRDPGSNRSDRRDISSDVRDLLDGDYETRAETALGRRSDSGGDRGDDERQINVHGNVGVGLAFKITPKINIGIEHQVSVVFGNEGDLIDGYRWRTQFDLTQYRDIVNYTNVRINFNIGKGDNTSEPLWWVSPLDLIAEDLAEVKARPVLDMTDTDKDGVIDMIDQEKDTKADCPVDTRGILLDSDGDGVADCDDEEPHSPPGYNTDTKGVAQVPDPEILDEDDVNRIVDDRLNTFKATLPVPEFDWFLPMIHFDLDRYTIKTSQYDELHQVAQVMKQNPSLRVVVTGHTDKLAGNCYNDLLSYNRANAAIDYLTGKYGIARDRLVLNWGGENSNIVPANGANLINRRVEFTVANDEAEMARPDCGVGSAGTGGSQYSGNKEAGY